MCFHCMGSYYMQETTVHDVSSGRTQLRDRLMVFSACESNLHWTFMRAHVHIPSILFSNHLMLAIMPKTNSMVYSQQTAM